MNDFIEKWKTDSRFKTKVKLGLYTLFIIIVAIFAFSNQGSISPDGFVDYYNNNINESDNNTIEIPDKYNYIINIKINNTTYQYNGTKDSQQESITKISNEITTNYIYKDNNYYKDDSGNYIITTKEEVYDIVSYNYLKLETINQYLSKSTKENDKYLVYLKDIILGSDSDNYITISITEDVLNDKNIIIIDYTSLMKLFDNTIESYLIEIEIEELG